jgi:hypothetical protein
LERRIKIKKFICAAKRDTKNINILSNSDDQKQVTNQGLYNKKAYNKSRASNQKGSKGLACSALPNQKNTNQSIDNRNSQIAYTKNGYNNNSLVEPIFDKTSDRTLVPMDFSPTRDISKKVTSNLLLTTIYQIWKINRVLSCRDLSMIQIKNSYQRR